MLRSLFVKLAGAFALVILVGAVVVTVLANQATAAQFRTYNDRSGQLWAHKLAPALSTYYSSSGSWHGVSTAMQDAAAMSRGTSASSPPAQAGSSAPTPLPTPTAPAVPEVRGGTEAFRPGESLPAQRAVPTASPSPTVPLVPGAASGMGMGRGMMGPGMSLAPALRSGANADEGVTSSPSSGPNTSQRMGPGGMMTPNPIPSPTPSTPAGNGATGGTGPQPQATAPGPASGAGRRGMMGGMGFWNTQGTSDQALADMWTMMGQRVIVADAAGQVVSDSAGSLQDRTLSSEQLEAGAPIQVDGQNAGTVLVTSAEVNPETLAGQFLAGVNRSIYAAVLAAGALAIGLGGLLAFQITLPLRKLKAAAAAIAAGDLTQRVSVGTHDELGDLARTFNYMADSLALAEAERRHMVADVAHELRTPLSVMQANLEAMQDGVLPLDADQIASLHEETVLLSRLVSDLRLLSLAEAGQLKLERVQASPDDLISRAVERLGLKAEERGIKLSVEAIPPLPSVLVDTDRINQVVGNLVSNALRYTPAGGEVAVQLRRADAEKSAASPDSASNVLVSVTDTGSGIPEADLPHVFDRFYRADKSRTRASGGSGLGLAIVKNLVEAHGGRVSVTSPVFHDSAGHGYGTRLTFTLPAMNASKPTGSRNGTLKSSAA